MAYSMDRHGNWHQQAGNDFEDDMADAFMYRLTKAVNKCDIKWKRTVIETRDKYPYLDQFQGTDIVINVRKENAQTRQSRSQNLHIDATMNFGGKNHMPVYKETGISIGGNPIMIGIRYGNNHADFEKPVVVLGMNMSAPDYRLYQDVIQSTLRQNAPELFRQCVEAYNGYMTGTDIGFQRNTDFWWPRREESKYDSRTQKQMDIINRREMPKTPLRRNAEIRQKNNEPKRLKPQNKPQRRAQNRNASVSDKRKRMMSQTDTLGSDITDNAVSPETQDSTEY